MRRFIKKALAGVMAAALVAGSMFAQLPVTAYADDIAVATTQQPFRVLSAEEMVAEMGTGWNLGNTMDGHTGFTPNETLWQNVVTTQKLIDAVHDAGFNTVRIPVTWGTMINDSDYSINEKWMSRVQDIVDYCIKQDMYVIINIHHDGAEQSGWLRIASDDFGAVKEKFAGVWETIAERFKDYDEHLIFESMNEVTGGDTDPQQDIDRIEELNQIFVDVVRSTGSNNALRWLSCPARYTNITVTTDDQYNFQLPNDTVEDRLFLAVHYYDWLFGLAENMTNTTWSEAQTAALVREFSQLTKFTDKGIPVILGEYGAINKQNEEQRAYHYEVVARLCKTGFIVPCYWDNGFYDLTAEPTDYCFTLIDRDTCELVYPSLVTAIMRGAFLEGPADCSDLAVGIETVAMTDFTLSTEKVNLELGAMYTIDVTETAPEGNNDIVLWKTADADIATVYNGNVRARGIGTTTLTAYSQSGSVAKEVTVTVAPQQCEVPCKEIMVQSGMSLEVGEYEYLNVQISPMDTDAYMTYTSTNEDVVTVSKLGKVLAKAEGSAYIIVTASSGAYNMIKVEVSEVGQSKELSLAANVYFNDSDASYFSNEYGEPITVNSDGTYTVVFDCATDLSDAAKAAGVTGLNNLTAIYIKDHGVTLGEISKTNLEACDIFYEKVVVDGTELTINMTEPKSALKASGIFDTNDPVNSWDGSKVDEVTVSNHVANFTTLENPQKVEITFTLSNMTFPGGEVVDDSVATQSITVTSGDTIEINEFGQTVQAAVSVVPANTTNNITFISLLPSVAAVNAPATLPDADGMVYADIVAVGKGEAVISVLSDDNVVATFTVAVTANDIPEMDAAATGEIILNNGYDYELPTEEVTTEPATEATTEAETTTEAPATTEAETTAKETEAGTVAAQPKKSGTMNTTTAIIIIVVALVVAGIGMFIALKPSKKNASSQTTETPEAPKAEDKAEEIKSDETK